MENNKNNKSNDKDEIEKLEKLNKQLNTANNIANMSLARYSQLQKLILKNPNLTNSSNEIKPYAKYTREQILGFLKDPKANAEKLIEASNYLYVTSPIYRRLVSYEPDMLTFDYILAPFKMKDIDSAKENLDKYKTQYYKILAKLDIMDIKHVFNKIAKVVMRDGAYFGIEVSNNDSYTLQQLPYSKCKISSWEDGCPLFSLDMSYFDKNKMLLESIGGYLEDAYMEYQSDKTNKKWIEMPSDSSICILFDETLGYIIPPLCGAFSDLYLLEDYKDLMKSKEIINLYKLISLKYPIDDKTGDLLMDEEVAKIYYNQIANQLDPTIALALNPFEMKEVSFDTDKQDNDGTLKAQRDLFSNVGISNLIFNNEKGSSNALLQSITNDFTFIQPVLRSLESWLNKKLKMFSGSIKFKSIFLDTTFYNRKEFADQLRKDMQYGIPNKTALCAVTTGYTPSDTIGVAFLENEVLNLADNFVVPQSANTMSSGDAGRPEKDDGELTESGIQTKEDGENGNR